MILQTYIVHWAVSIFFQTVEKVGLFCQHMFKNGFYVNHVNLKKDLQTQLQPCLTTIDLFFKSIAKKMIDILCHDPKVFSYKW